MRTSFHVHEPRSAREPMQAFRHIRRRCRIFIPEHVQNRNADLLRARREIFVYDFFETFAHHGRKSTVFFRTEFPIRILWRDFPHDAVTFYAQSVPDSPPRQKPGTTGQQRTLKGRIRLRQEFQCHPAPERMCDQVCVANPQFS